MHYKMFSWISSLTNINYDKYKDILEYIPKDNNKIKYSYYNENKVLKCFIDYVKREEKNKYIVSLSGGVDSMVVASILCYLKV